MAYHYYKIWNDTEKEMRVIFHFLFKKKILFCYQIELELFSNGTDQLSNLILEQFDNVHTNTYTLCYV